MENKQSSLISVCGSEVTVKVQLNKVCTVWYLVATSYLHPQEEERQNPEEKKEAEEDAGGVKDLAEEGGDV